LSGSLEERIVSLGTGRLEERIHDDTIIVTSVHLPRSIGILRLLADLAEQEGSGNDGSGSSGGRGRANGNRVDSAGSLREDNVNRGLNAESARSRLTTLNAAETNVGLIVDLNANSVGLESGSSVNTQGGKDVVDGGGSTLEGVGAASDNLVLDDQVTAIVDGDVTFNEQGGRGSADIRIGDSDQDGGNSGTSLEDRVGLDVIRNNTVDADRRSSVLTLNVRDNVVGVQETSSGNTVVVGESQHVDTLTSLVGRRSVADTPVLVASIVTSNSREDDTSVGWAGDGGNISADSGTILREHLEAALSLTSARRDNHLEGLLVGVDGADDEVTLSVLEGNDVLVELISTRRKRSVLNLDNNGLGIERETILIISNSVVDFEVRVLVEFIESGLEVETLNEGGSRRGGVAAKRRNEVNRASNGDPGGGILRIDRLGSQQARRIVDGEELEGLGGAADSSDDRSNGTLLDIISTEEDAGKSESLTERATEVLLEGANVSASLDQVGLGAENNREIVTRSDDDGDGLEGGLELLGDGVRAGLVDNVVDDGLNEQVRNLLVVVGIGGRLVDDTELSVSDNGRELSDLSTLGVGKISRELEEFAHLVAASQRGLGSVEAQDDGLQGIALTKPGVDTSKSDDISGILDHVEGLDVDNRGIVDGENNDGGLLGDGVDDRVGVLVGISDSVGEGVSTIPVAIISGGNVEQPGQGSRSIVRDTLNEDRGGGSVDLGTAEVSGSGIQLEKLTLQAIVDLSNVEDKVGVLRVDIDGRQGEGSGLLLHHADGEEGGDRRIIDSLNEELESTDVGAGGEAISGVVGERAKQPGRGSGSTVHVGGGSEEDLGSGESVSINVHNRAGLGDDGAIGTLENDILREGLDDVKHGLAGVLHVLAREDDRGGDVLLSANLTDVLNDRRIIDLQNVDGDGDNGRASILRINNLEAHGSVRSGTVDAGEGVVRARVGSSSFR